MAKHASKLAKELESLKKRLQASKNHLIQTELKAEDLNALIESTRRTWKDNGLGQKPSDKEGGN